MTTFQLKFELKLPALAEARVVLLADQRHGAKRPRVAGVWLAYLASLMRRRRPSNEQRTAAAAAAAAAMAAAAALIHQLLGAQRGRSALLQIDAPRR